MSNMKTLIFGWLFHVAQQPLPLNRQAFFELNFCFKKISYFYNILMAHFCSNILNIIFYNTNIQTLTLKS